MKTSALGNQFMEVSIDFLETLQFFASWLSNNIKRQ